jgi:two-component system, NtrC family, response regulator PilR
MRLPDGNGIELVEHIQQQYPQLPVAMITAYGSMDAAIAALKAGAFDFVSKPVDLQMLRNLINSALALSGSEPRNRERGRPSRRPARRRPVHAAHARDHRQAGPQPGAGVHHGRIGQRQGTGGRAIHQLGPRCRTALRAGQLRRGPTELMESEFFGHKKGAFTGASQRQGGAVPGRPGRDPVPRRGGRVAPAHAGQAAARHPGAGGTARGRQPGDPRGRAHPLRHPPEPAALVAEGQLPAGPLLPAQRHRTAGAAPARAAGGPAPAGGTHPRAHRRDWGSEGFRLGPDALAHLETYRYPGNVRELENILERAATLCEGHTIHAADLHLPDHTHAADRIAEPAVADRALDDLLEERERQAILRALARTGGNRTAAARLLGISFRQMRYRLKKLGIE